MKSFGSWKLFGLAALLAASLSQAAGAEPLKLEAVLAPQEQIRLDFEGEPKHFLLMVRRTGEAKGEGALAGAQVTEYGYHDILPGQDGDPRGYLEFRTPSGEVAYVKWQVRAVFLPTPEGKPKLVDHGFWELAGGTGRFAAAKGVGRLEIKAAGQTERLFALEGEIATP